LSVTLSDTSQPAARAPPGWPSASKPKAAAAELKRRWRIIAAPLVVSMLLSSFIAHIADVDSLANRSDPRVEAWTDLSGLLRWAARFQRLRAPLGSLGASAFGHDAKGEVRPIADLSGELQTSDRIGGRPLEARLVWLRHAPYLAYGRACLRPACRQHGDSTETCRGSSSLSSWVGSWLRRRPRAPPMRWSDGRPISPTSCVELRRPSRPSTAPHSGQPQVRLSGDDRFLAPNEDLATLSGLGLRGAGAIAPRGGDTIQE
jgi:hypothetical protein